MYSYKNTAGSRSAFGGRKRRYTSAAPRSGGKRRQDQYIDPARFVKAARVVEATDEYVARNQFADFEVDKQLKANLITKGYQTPSPIQDQTIPAALAGKDIIGIANTGTGKTAAFAVPVLQALITNRNARALIIAPTRELAQQIKEECDSISKGLGIYSTLIIGGTNIGAQFRNLRSNPRLVIGTPGRIKDHLERNTLHLSKFNLVVLDEVDRMLDMGFLPSVTLILKQVSPERQSFFFSATLDQKVRSLIEGFAQDPVTVTVKTGDTGENIHQNVVRYGTPSEKIDKLHDILIDDGVEKIIVFDETQRKVERLSKELIARGFQADAIHGGKSQGQRKRALDRFKSNQITVLVATDVAARGIDVTDITHVINYSTPQTYDDYVHRIGRTGRAGRTGHALTFVNQ